MPISGSSGALLRGTHIPLRLARERQGGDGPLIKIVSKRFHVKHICVSGKKEEGYRGEEATAQ
jgi:hypothetical protein